MVDVRRKTLVTLGLVCLLALSIYGFVSHHLAAQRIWDASGAVRFGIFLAASAAWFAGWIAFRRVWMVPATALFVAVYSAWMVGPLAVAVVVVFLFACFVLGRILFRGAPLALVAGVCAIEWLIALMAHFPVNYPAVYAAILVAILAARPALTRDCLRAIRAPKIASGKEAVALAIAITALLAHLLVALKPEVSSDALSMHMVVPAYVADHHLWSFDFHHWTWAVMPMGAVWSYTFTYLLGGEFAARLLNWSLLAALCGLLYRMAQKWLSNAAAWMIVAMFAATPALQLVTGSLFVETFYALMLVAALAALWDSRIVLSAFLLASSMAVKLMALPFAIPIGIALLWQGRREPRRLAAALLLILVLAPLPYLYAWRTTGNPAFPYANSVFRSPYFAPVMSPDPRFLEPLTWRTPFDVTFATAKFWEGQNGSAGFQFLLLAPLVLLALGRGWGFAEWTLAASAWGGTLLGLLLRPNVRYLYPAFPLLTLSIALLPFTRLLWAAMVGCFAVDLWFLPSSSFYHKTFCLNPFERDAARHYLAEAAPARLMVERLNREHSGENALFLGTMDIAQFRGIAYGDGWHYYTFMNEALATSSHLEMFQFLRKLGIRHFLYPAPKSGDRIHDLEFAWCVQHFTAPAEEIGTFRLASLRPEFTGADADARAASEDHPEAPVPPGVYDDFDLRIRYFGHWSHDSQFEAAAGHSLTYTDVPGASLQFAFHGRAITWLYTKALNRGMAAVFIDGTSKGDFDLYAPGTAWQSRMEFSALADGDQVLEIRVLDRKNASSSGTYIDLDQLIVQ